MRKLLPAVLLPLLLLTGCSGSVDQSQVEKRTDEQLSQKAGIEAEKVECPGDLSAKEGAKMTCDVTSTTGDKFKVELTVTATSDDQVTWDVDVVA